MLITSIHHQPGASQQVPTFAKQQHATNLDQIPVRACAALSRTITLKAAAASQDQLALDAALQAKETIRAAAIANTSAVNAGVTSSHGSVVAFSTNAKPHMAEIAAFDSELDSDSDAEEDEAALPTTGASASKSCPETVDQ
jgi:hypothetical protein